MDVVTVILRQGTRALQSVRVPHQPLPERSWLIGRRGGGQADPPLVTLAGGSYDWFSMAAKPNQSLSPRIANRRALHDYFIESKLECGIALQGSEVKSLREGNAQLQDAYVSVDGGDLVLHNAHIDPYKKAAIVYNHEPRRDRKLLAHCREIKKLADESSQKGITLVPLAIYFKNGRAKVEVGVARGKKEFDKRETIKRKEQDREIRRVMSRRA